MNLYPFFFTYVAPYQAFMIIHINTLTLFQQQQLGLLSSCEPKSQLNLVHQHCRKNNQCLPEHHFSIPFQY